ncbi:MAG: TatD family hydrolase [Parcubacteria group bacterium]|nr:TatD family hydrolase [Parcubacteria group bacterium]
MFFDTHTHVNFIAYKDDDEVVLKRAYQQGTWLVNVGTQKDTSKKSVELASRFEKGVYASIGLHPVHLDGDRYEEYFADGKKSEFKVRRERFDYDYYANLAKHPRVVAVGEVGLDYYKRKKSEIFELRNTQIENLLEHLKLALEFDLPLIIHCRDAHSDLKRFVADHRKEMQKVGAVVHCFTAKEDDAKYYISCGMRISFTGLITFCHDWDDIIEKTDIAHILSETDAPYLTPVPHRGKRNEPSFVKYVVARIAEIKRMDAEEVEKRLFENALSFFKKISP